MVSRHTKLNIINIILLSIFVTIQCFSQIECSKLKSSVNNLKSNRLSINEINETEKYNVSFYSLDIELTDQSTYISGNADIILNTLESLDSIIIELHENLTISNLEVNNVPTLFYRKNSAVVVLKHFEKSEQIKISISYEGLPPNINENPLGGSGLNNKLDPSTNTLVTYSLSEPYSAYEWWPCKQSLTDKADSCYINITVPSNCLAGSNGILTNKTELNNGKTRFEWRHIYPINYYLISVAIAQYQDYSFFVKINDKDSLLIQNFIYDNSNYFQTWKSNIDSTSAYLRLFSTFYGEYPYLNEKYGHCSAPLGGGMEHQTMTTQIHFNKNLTAHELAHQWFGNNVTCKSWKDIWVNEGFATYSQYLMLEKLYPDEALAQIIAYQNKSMEYLDGSIYVLDTINTSRIFDYRLTYAKGAAFIHTLRYLVNNDSLFFNNLKQFQKDFKGGSASAEDVRLYLEKNSNIELKPAFDQLYYGEGFPTYKATWNSFGTDLIIELSQSPSGEFLTQVFTQPVELKIELTDKKDTIIKVNFDKPTQKFYFENFGKINQIKSIDPNYWLIKKVDTIYKDEALDLSNITNISFELIDIYPNPTIRCINIIVHNLNESNIEITDLKGKTLFNQTFTKEIEIDLTKLSKGKYLAKVKTSNNTIQIKKIIKL